MFKRANKITALLVAAASVMSVVPAMASDRLGTKDGTIDNAVAYKDGKYLYEGYRSDDDDQGVYYNAGDKDKLLEDIEDADLGYDNGKFTTAYDDKYATAVDGSDEYLVDLTNGDVIDDDSASDRLDEAATKLKSALKKTDRYDDGVSVEETDLQQITSGAKFGDVWYQYAAVPTAEQDNSIGAGQGQLFGYTNQSGKYVDASNVANIYAYSTAKGKVVKIDEYNDYDSDTKLYAQLEGQPTVLTQDKDNIYVLSKVVVTDADTDAIPTTTTTTAVANVDDNVNGVVSSVHYYVQKISKAQGDKKDDAYLPKSVDSYELLVSDKVNNTDVEKLDNGDSKDAYDAVMEALGSNLSGFSVVNGQLLAIYNDGGNVKVTSINLKKDKVEYVNAASEPANLNSDKVDVYLAEKDDDDDVDVDSDHPEKAYDVDVDGNVWVVADGKIYKFTNNEMTKVYSVDSSLDAISVYDEKDLITWEVDGDIYTTVTEGTAETEAEAPAPTPAKVGWDQLADGTWNFYDATGTKVVSNWVNVGGVWYYLKADGVMATGWLNDNGTWYYLKSSGAMATGWLNDNGTWYYLNASGAMLANTTVDGYVLGASGAWIQ